MPSSDTPRNMNGATVVLRLMLAASPILAIVPPCAIVLAILTFGLVAITGGFTRPAFAVEPGQTIEISEQQAAFGRDLGALVQAASGVALLIDYGRARAEAGDTLQGLRRHQKVDPLETPGEVDLTQWADFPSVLEAALHAGADVTGCLGQGDFLRRLGIEARAERLKTGRPDAAPVIDRQLHRLTAYTVTDPKARVTARKRIRLRR